VGIQQAIDVAEIAQPGGAFSLAIAAGEFVFTAGQVGATADGHLHETLDDQVHQALDNLEAVLRASNCALSDVVKTTCFLADPTDFAVFNRIYADRFPAPLPARSTVGVAFAGEGSLLFEIEAVAIRPQRSGQ
jgi:2-iminobutanoate/2-iminopropanoate deaminase